MRPSRSIFLCCVAFWCNGCGPSRLLPLPEQMPPSIDGRKLWNVPVAYVYAADASLAGQTERWIDSLAGHVRRTYDGQLGKGLVIVVHKEEEPFIESFEEMIRLQRLMARQSGLPESQVPTLRERRQKLAESGMEEKVLLGVTAVSLDRLALERAGLADVLPEDVEWCICCPSHERMEAAMWKTGPVALEKKKGKAFAVMTAWAWPLAFPQAAKVFRLARDTLAFQLWAIRNDEWSPDQRLSETERYTKERAFVLSPTLALAMSIAKKQATSQPAAAPE